MTAPHEDTVDWEALRAAAREAMGRAYADGRNTDRGPEAETATAALSPYLRRRLVLEQEAVDAALAAGVGPSPGVTVSAVATSASMNGRGAAPCGARDAPASRPWRTTTRSHPPANPGFAATSSAQDASAVSRCIRAAVRRNTAARSR